MNIHSINYSTNFKSNPLYIRLNKILRTIFYVISFTFISISYSQQISDYSKTQSDKIDSIVNSYSQKDKFKVLNFLPNVSFDALNNSFNVGFSLNGISNYYQQKKRNKIELAKLEQSLKERLEKEIEQIEIEIQSFQISYSTLSSEIELFQMDFDLFQISKGKYENKEISIEDFLKLKKAFVYKKNSLKTDVLKLSLSASKIEQKTKSDVLTKSLVVLTNSINNYD